MKLITLSLAAIVALTGCNTLSGLGQDIQKGGQKISNSAQSNTN